MIEEAESYKPEATGVVQIEDFMNILKTQSWATTQKPRRAKSDVDPDGQLLINFASTFVLIKTKSTVFIAVFLLYILKQIKCKKIIKLVNKFSVQCKLIMHYTNAAAAAESNDPNNGSQKEAQL